MQLLEIGADVEWPDSEVSTALRDKLSTRSGLGHLAGLAEWAVGVRARTPGFERVAAVVVGGEPPDVVAETAAALGVDLRVLPAEGGVAEGAALADSLAESGTELVVVGVPGVDVDAAVAVSVLTNTEPVKVLSRGVAATDPEAWMALATGVRDARRRCMPHRDDPDALLAELASPRLAVAAGVVLAAARRRTPVLLDGAAVAAAALVAYEAQPRAVRWWSAADLGEDPVQELALTRLGQRAILGMGTGLGDGLAGLLAVPVLRAAIAVASA